DYFELLEIQNSSIAITDEKLKITWFNKSFKKKCGSSRIKGKTLTSLFDINLPAEIDSDSFTKSLIIPLPDSGINIIISSIPAERKNSQNSYFIELIPIIDQQAEDRDKEFLQRSIRFQNELQNILILLVKENSL